MSTPSDHDDQQAPPPTPGPLHTVEGHALYRAAARLFAHRDAQAVLRQVVRAAQTITGADGAAILLYDGETARFVPAVPSVTVGLDERWLRGQGLDAAQSLERRAVEARDVVEVLDTASMPGVAVPLLA